MANNSQYPNTNSFVEGSRTPTRTPTRAKYGGALVLEQETDKHSVSAFDLGSGPAFGRMDSSVSDHSNYGKEANNMSEYSTNATVARDGQVMQDYEGEVIQRETYMFKPQPAPASPYRNRSPSPISTA